MKRFYFLFLTLISSIYGFCQQSSKEFEIDTLSYCMDGNADGEFCVDDLICEPLTDSGLPSEESSFDSSTDNKIDKTVASTDYKESKYWGRYTALRTAGWITLGTGGLFFLAGSTMILSAIGNDSDSADALGVAGSLLLFSAPVLVIASIPLLGCAYWNRNKAKKMYLNVGASLLPSDKTSPFDINTPAISLALRF